MGALYKMQICISLWCLATFSVCSGSWSRIPAPSDGVPESVTATAQYLWAIDDRMGEFITSSNNNVIYCQRPCTDGNWTDAFGQLEQIDANDGEIWGINDRSQVYRRASNTSVGEWVRVGGRGDDKCKEPLCMSDISVSRNGAYIWGVSTENATYMCQNRQDCSGNNWMLVQNSLEISIVQIDAGDEEVWGVNASNYIFKRPVNGSREWTMVPGTMRYVSASGITYIWGIAPNNSLFNCEKPCTGDWQYIGGSFRQIDGADDYVVGVTSKNHVFALSIEGNSSPLLFPQSLQVTTQGPLQFVETTVTRLPTTIVSTTTSTITIAGTVGFLAGLHVVVLTIILVLSALCIRRRRSRKAHGGNDSLGAANHQMTTSWTSSGCNDQINDDNGHLYESIRDPLPPPLPHPRSQGTVTVLESSSDLRDDLQQNIAYVPSHGVKTDLAANHEQTIDVETSHIDTVPNVAYQDSSTCNEYLKIV